MRVCAMDRVLQYTSRRCKDQRSKIKSRLFHWHAPRCLVDPRPSRPSLKGGQHHGTDQRNGGADRNGDGGAYPRLSWGWCCGGQVARCTQGRNANTCCATAGGRGGKSVPFLSNRCARRRSGGVFVAVFIGGNPHENGFRAVVIIHGAFATTSKCLVRNVVVVHDVRRVLAHEGSLSVLVLDVSCESCCHAAGRGT